MCFVANKRAGEGSQDFGAGVGLREFPPGHAVDGNESMDAHHDDHEAIGGVDLGPFVEVPSPNAPTCKALFVQGEGGGHVLDRHEGHHSESNEDLRRSTLHLCQSQCQHGAGNAYESVFGGLGMEDALIPIRFKPGRAVRVQSASSK